MKWIISTVVLTTLVFTGSEAAFAKTHKKHHCVHPVINYKDELPAPIPVAVVNAFVPHWYVGGHVGVSRTHDEPALRSNDSVTQIGPGWTADLGYQLIQFYRATLAAELGFTQYHNSNETLPGVNVAYTEHFATYLAAVAQYPIICNFNILGKLGLAYSYAKKVFNVSGASASANAYSPYYGVGLSYNMTSQAALMLQWARARGIEGILCK